MTRNEWDTQPTSRSTVLQVVQDIIHHTCGSLHPRLIVGQISLGFGQNQMLDSCVYYKVCKFLIQFESYPGLGEGEKTLSPLTTEVTRQRTQDNEQP